MQGLRQAGLGLAAVGLLLVAGCGVAPAGADNDSPAIGPTTAVSAGNFPAFPVPGTYAAYGNNQYTVLQKTVTGINTRTFHIDAAPVLLFWLSCLGQAGQTAELSSPDLGLDWSVPCGAGAAAEPQAITFQPTTGIAAGTPVKVLATVTLGARWEVRIDVPYTAPSTSPAASPGTTASPSASPSASPGTPSRTP